MRRSIRLAIAVSAALASLAFAGSAMAAYAPSLIVTSLNNAPGQSTTLLLGHVQGPDEDPTVKDTIYAPLGYGVTLGQPVGTKIGELEGTVILRGVANTQVDVQGDVIADDPAAHPNDPCAPGLHGAVWKVTVTINQVPITVFIYVDAVTAGPEAAFASAKVQLCLAGPVGTPGGAQLLFALFDVNGVFRNPANTNDRLWRATFTPYTPGTPNPNPAGTVEGQALVPGRVSLKLTVKSLKRGRIIISGRLLVSGSPFRGASVELYVGNRRVARVRTNAAGRFTVKKRIKKKTRYRSLVAFVGDLPACPAPPLPGVPQGCKSATISFVATSKTVTARRRR
jgi:hypothetical protein